MNLKMPDLSTNGSPIKVIRWLIEVGDFVERGQAVLEVETDKAAMEVEALGSGTLLQQLVPVGSDASAGDLLAVIGEAQAAPTGSADGNGAAATNYQRDFLLSLYERMLLIRQFEDRVKAVIELASLTVFTASHLAFLEQLTASIGIVLNSIEATMQTEGLLKQSQQLATELQTQQTELQQTNEQLAQKAQQLAEQNVEVERKNQEIEQARRAVEEKAKELALTSKYKSEFLANMSHELRTPLNSILVLGQQLVDNPDHNLTPKQVEFARTIHGAGTDLLNLITDILDLSKIESNHVELKIEKFDLSTVVREVVATVEPMVGENNNKLVVKCPQDLGIVSTDQTKLRQATLNLLSNAAKFTHDGTITLTVQRRKRQAGDWIEIQVEDTGIGIADADVSRLFQNFGQVSRSTSSKFGGTGLGLALSQKLCALMGGGISVKSGIGQGSCFSIRVLAWMTEQQNTEEADGAALSFSNLVTV